jgi:hypothetical protein
MRYYFDHEKLESIKLQTNSSHGVKFLLEGCRGKATSGNSTLMS